MIELRVTEVQLRRLVAGGVRDAMATHPEYFTEQGRRNARDGIAKRVVGTLRGFAAQAVEGRDPAANRGAEQGALHSG